jgi:hypothetical protein
MGRLPSNMEWTGAHAAIAGTGNYIFPIQLTTVKAVPVFLIQRNWLNCEDLYPILAYLNFDKLFTTKF